MTKALGKKISGLFREVNPFTLKSGKVKFRKKLQIL